MEKEISLSRSNINLHEIIETIRNQLLQKCISQISNTNSINPFNEIKPLSTNDFQQELSKYNMSLDNSYIEGVISQINAQLFIRLLNKTEENILQNLIASSNDLIKPLTSIDLIQNYKLDLDDRNINILLTNLNRNIEMENKARKKNIKYKRLTECFIELAENEIQKDAIKQIMETGEYNGFKLNSMLSTKKDDEKVERRKRIDCAEMILHYENLFFYLVNNGINVFHGTKIGALETILNKGLMSSTQLNENEIQLNSGEENMKKNIFGLQDEKRTFVSLTDDLSVATQYSNMGGNQNQISEQNIPIIICFNGNEIKEKYFKSFVYVSSDFAEIPITSSINPSDIKCVITSYDKIEYVKSVVSQYGVDVLGFDSNNNFKKQFIGDTKESKFYNIINNTVEVDEKEFERTKERLQAKRMNQSVEHLSADQSMMIASDVKMDIVFNLTEQYNKGIPFKPLTADDLIAKYNMNENVAQQLALEVNTMLENYIREKEYQAKNYTPFVIDGFEEENNSMGGKSR